MLTIILFILSAICNAITDIISRHFEISIFSSYNNKYWNPSVSCNDDNVCNKMCCLQVFRCLDAYHLFKSLMIIFLILAIVFYNKKNSNIVLDFMMYSLIWNCTFSICYDWLFIKKI